MSAVSFDPKLLIEPARALARRVSDFIRSERLSFDNRCVEYKTDRSMVSYVDRKAESMLIEGLAELVKEATFISEETHANPNASQQAEWTWIIDPLDGTTNFTHGIPYYCLSFALLHAEKIVFGLTYDIVLEHCYYAVRNGGAFCDDRPLRVAVPRPNAPIYYALAFSTPTREDAQDLFQLVNHILKDDDSFRRYGAAALSLAHTAAGRFDAFFDLGLKIWDMAAGLLLIKEAGGMVSDIYGKPVKSNRHGSILAGAPNAYHKLLAHANTIWNKEKSNS